MTGISVPHVSPEQILSFRFKLPSVDTQHLICARVETEAGQITALVATVRDGIKALSEWRMAFITSAVTGAIDVGAAA
jgi:type I restriction enzyme S subunit